MYFYIDCSVLFLAQTMKTLYNFQLFQGVRQQVNSVGYFLESQKNSCYSIIILFS